jgi:hypothetical protein
LPLLKEFYKIWEACQLTGKRDQNSKEKSESTPSFVKLLVKSKAFGVKQLRTFN